VAVVYENYPESQISKENFVDFQRAIIRLVDEHPGEWCTPRQVDSYWVKGAAIVVCHDEMTKDWLAARVPTLVAWEDSRLKIVGLNALPTYKRVVAWFPGPVEDTKQYLLRLHRLNQGLDTKHRRVMSAGRSPMWSTLCSASMKPLSPCWRGWVGGPSVEWGRLLSPF